MSTESLHALLARQSLADVLPPELTRMQPLVLDLTATNPALSALALADPNAFGRYIDGELTRSRTRLAIGRYDEDRVIYRSRPLFGERRSVHLGVDLFVPAGTLLRLPLAGRVHSLADNAGLGDYGPTIIVEHTMGARCFHTLWGHLARASLRNRTVGEAIEMGQALAVVGGHDENGGWPPHVHVQLIADIGEAWGDFPGVATHADRGRMLARCPDPSPLLGLEPYASPRSTK